MRYFIYCRKSSEGEERQVLSLASQQEALAKAFGGNSEIEIVGVYEEAKSAKTPGRPLFAEMLERIEAGEAEGIASWAPDRLARNSIDGGRIADAHSQSHDRIAMNAAQPFRCPDADALRKRRNDFDLPVKRKNIRHGTNPLLWKAPSADLSHASLAGIF